MGSTFEIHLPRLCSEPVADAPAPRFPTPVVRCASTILMVEDELVVRQFAVEVLTPALHLTSGRIGGTCSQDSCLSLSVV